MKNKTPLNELSFLYNIKECISKCEKLKDDYYKIIISDCNEDQGKICLLLEKWTSGNHITPYLEGLEDTIIADYFGEFFAE